MDKIKIDDFATLCKDKAKYLKSFLENSTANTGPCTKNKILME